MPKKYGPKPTAQRKAIARAQAQRNRRRAAYNKATKQRTRNMIRPMVEGKTKVAPRQHLHCNFNNSTGVAESSLTGQMSINAAVANKSLKNTTIIVPSVFSDMLVPGVNNEQVIGRAYNLNYIKLKTELNFSSVKSNLSYLHDNIWCVQGLCKVKLSKALDQTAIAALTANPVSSTNRKINEAMCDVVSKQLIYEEFDADSLDFPRKRKNVWIMKRFRVKPNLTQRFHDVTTALEATGETGVSQLPINYSFNWTYKRKIFTDSLVSHTSGPEYRLNSQAYIPFVLFYNRNAAIEQGHPTPELSNSCKMWYTDS